MAEVHHFTYGVFNPLAAYLLAFLGSFFGLLGTARARDARTSSRRNRWLLISAFAIGGGAIWLMHFAAMLGFEVPDSPVRFDIPMTVLSLAFAVAAVGTGLLIVGHGRRSLPKVIAAGVLTGGGVLAMHYTGMYGMNVAGEMRYDLGLVVASAIIAVVASTVALWFAVSVRGWAPISGAAAIMAVAVCGMHYTGMAAMSVHLDPATPTQVDGFRPLTMIVPITLITAATIVGVALSALQAMTEEEFTDGAGTPRRGVHAETAVPWSLKQATMATPTVGRRPSPRPVPLRSPTNG
ncbi:MHYT domain-containing signal sensor [Paractinoplanes deccanensis]|uniref:MHYT domain-containing signal sensor n=1 Tax=Paractinoplanes deccanensis TaxID=113561 RepID=A0ABQ3Y0X4_9ACTN|nr:MHYT domain-containing protein [Actinoplanes deccanensis]GID73630.1 MHYT domain-containing signal sensor [Actinoplanes deccanensis]